MNSACAIDVLKTSNTALAQHISFIEFNFTDPRKVPYNVVDYCKREYEAVDLAISALQDKIEKEEKPQMSKQLGQCVGDTVWLLLDKTDAEPPDIVQSRIVKYEKNLRREVISCFIDCPQVDNTLEFEDTDIGRTVFFSPDAAKAILES